MEKLTLQSIRRENVRKVLESIARNKHTTKLQISEDTGLSLMTVGKITELLGSHGIILHGKNVNQKAGRRAEVFRLRKDWLIPVFFVASRSYKFYIVDLEGNVHDKGVYNCVDDPMYASSEFVAFLRGTLNLLRQNYSHQKALGIGVAIAGTYDEATDSIRSAAMPELGRIKLMENIRKIFRQKNLVIENANRLCAAGLVEYRLDRMENTVTCLQIGDIIECTTYDHGKTIDGGGLAGRLGDLPHTHGVSYANFLSTATESKHVESTVVDLLKIIACAYDPDKIYVCSEKFTFDPAQIKTMRSLLATELTWAHEPPEVGFIHSTELEAMSGVISRLIENWLFEMTKTDE